MERIRFTPGDSDEEFLSKLGSLVSIVPDKEEALMESLDYNELGLEKFLEDNKDICLALVERVEREGTRTPLMKRHRVMDLLHDEIHRKLMAKFEALPSEYNRERKERMRYDPDSPKNARVWVTGPSIQIPERFKRMLVEQCLHEIKLGKVVRPEKTVPPITNDEDAEADPQKGDVTTNEQIESEAEENPKTEGGEEGASAEA
jgi:hypothetical protein